MSVPSIEERYVTALLALGEDNRDRLASTLPRHMANDLSAVCKMYTELQTREARGDPEPESEAAKLFDMLCAANPVLFKHVQRYSCRETITKLRKIAKNAKKQSIEMQLAIKDAEERATSEGATRVKHWAATAEAEAKRQEARYKKRRRELAPIVVVESDDSDE